MTGYTDEFRAQRAAEKAREEQEQKAREKESAAIRQARLDKLAAERQAQQARRAAVLEARLAPTKERAKREWLYPIPTRHLPTSTNEHGRC